MLKLKSESFRHYFVQNCKKIKDKKRTIKINFKCRKGDEYEKILNNNINNGLYSMPSGTATWIIKVDDNGNQTVEYIKSEIR